MVEEDWGKFLITRKQDCLSATKSRVLLFSSIEDRDVPKLLFFTESNLQLPHFHTLFYRLYCWEALTINIWHVVFFVCHFVSHDLFFLPNGQEACSLLLDYAWELSNFKLLFSKCLFYVLFVSKNNQLPFLCKRTMTFWIEFRLPESQSVIRRHTCVL